MKKKGCIIHTLHYKFTTTGGCKSASEEREGHDTTQKRGPAAMNQERRRAFTKLGEAGDRFGDYLCVD